MPGLGNSLCILQGNILKFSFKICCELALHRNLGFLRRVLSLNKNELQSTGTAGSRILYYTIIICISCVLVIYRLIGSVHSDYLALVVIRVAHHIENLGINHGAAHPCEIHINFRAAFSRFGAAARRHGKGQSTQDQGCHFPDSHTNLHSSAFDRRQKQS